MQTPARKTFFSNLFVFGLFLMAASLPYSKATLSLSLIILILSWLLHGDLKEKFIRFSKNKTALVLSSLFFAHLVGLLYTSDFNYGLEDLNKKLPLFLLPLMFSTMPPLSKQLFEKLAALFALSVIVATFICFAAMLGYSHKQVLHPQEASLYISHIRFGLLISMCVFILVYFIRELPLPMMRLGLGMLVIWLIAFLIMMESATGLVCTIAAGAVLCLRQLISMQSKAVKYSLLAIFVLTCIASARIFSETVSKFENVTAGKLKLLAQTRNGNPYAQDTLNMEIENGNYVWRNVCEKELEEEWNKKSALHYTGKDLRGNEIKYTLIRFLASKGVNKDAEAVLKLSDKEVQAIEKGVPDVNYMGVFNPTARLQKIVWEYDTYLRGGNPSGHSVVQRFEFWKAAMGIIGENPIIGVGTGDVKNAFEEQYKKMNSPLSQEWRLRSHNQFLAITSALGIIGLLLFLFTFLFPLFADNKYRNYLYLMFFIIAFLSMISEDTLENQSGVTFYAFFNSLLLFLYRGKETTEQK